MNEYNDTEGTLDDIIEVKEDDYEADVTQEAREEEERKQIEDS